MRSATKGTTLSLIIGLFFFQASYSNSQQGRVRQVAHINFR